MKFVIEIVKLFEKAKTILFSEEANSLDVNSRAIASQISLETYFG